MPKLTYLIAIELHENEWERAGQLVSARPLQDLFEQALSDAGISGTVEASFDGRKAPKARAENATPPPNGRAAATVATEAG